jgi:hypothetical protein
LSTLSAPLCSSEVGLPGIGTEPLVEYDTDDDEDDDDDDDKDDGDGTGPYRLMGTVRIFSP